LSIWTHYLKDFEFLASYKQPGGGYRGSAARVGAGIQVYEAFAHAARHNVTLPAASCLTVGSYGGWITGGGHSPLSSKFGLGVDQVLSLQVVTADGRAVTADPVTNPDLFFALRGGGGSEFLLLCHCFFS
jgi:FAD/FMN-containing dehydrogenase